MTTVSAALLVFAALVAPGDPGGLTPWALARIPVEGLLAAALVLVLPSRPSRLLAALFGAALGVVTVMKIVDLGFTSVLDRPFDPLWDWRLFGDGFGFVSSTSGQAAAIGCVVAAVLLAAAVPVLLALSTLRLSRVVARHRTPAVRALAVLTPVWVVCALLGAQLAPGLPVAGASAAGAAYGDAMRLRANLLDQREFAHDLATDAFRDTPRDQLLTALRGKDVVISFVESYGRDAIQNPMFAPGVGAVLDDGDRRLAAAGFGSRSAYLTSPTFGGASWLAHSTLLSGLWIDNQERYRELESSDRLTLTRAFREASWRTVGVMPGVTTDWPEAAFYGYDRLYDSRNLGYRGPKFSWATMPDQYTLTAFDRLEREVPARPPLMAEIPLVSSHAPWSPLPRPVDWADVGDGSVFNSMSAPGDLPQAILTRDPAVVRAGYRDSVEYSLSTLISYLETRGGDDLVFVFLGDHQPSPIVTGPNASRDVPITIVTKDRAVLDRISSWGWHDGLKPGADAPVWRMDAFRDRFLTAFGPRTEPLRASADH
ncbi:sulfatase [Pseudonocardia acaciae]|uniref:sulfatase n=1 Tax=Pseudonocardia acaciae TaxID=551276 RepID=UPI000AD65980|nr:sulfatase [Pseudonocardia acaciae]